MAAAKTKKRSIIIGNKEYTMPQKMSTMAYLRYLEVRDSIMDTEAKQALYTRQQFMDMMDVIVEMYGNQFTTDDMLDTETGMTPDSIVMEFALMDVSVGEKVNKGDVICYVEAMKTYNAIRAEYDGTITAICANSGDTVSEDDVLMKIV